MLAFGCPGPQHRKPRRRIAATHSVSMRATKLHNAVIAAVTSSALVGNATAAAKALTALVREHSATTGLQGCAGFVGLGASE